MKYNIKDGMVSYFEYVINDIEKVHNIKSEIKYCIEKLKMDTNSEKVKEFTSQLKEEMSKKRKIEYEFPLKNIKNNCCDCGVEYLYPFEVLILNYISRGNYCASCNAKYNK